LTIEALSLKLDGELEATQLLGDVQIKGQLKSNPFSPRELLEGLGQPAPPTADPKVLKNAKIDLAFNANPNQASMSQLGLVLDDTRITGNGSIKSFESPQIRFAVNIDQIDVDRYLPPKQEEPKESKPEQKPAPQTETDDQITLPMDALRSLNINGQIKVGSLKMANLRLADVQATLTAKNGLIELKPVKTSLYGGHVNSAVRVDARKDIPGFGMTTNLKNVQMGDLIYDLQQDQAYLRGTGNLSFNLNTQGNRISILKKQLGGTISLSVTDGALRDRELAAKIEAIVAFLKKREPAPSGEELIFQSLTSSAKINKGVMRNDDLNLITSLILAKGQGEANLGNDTVDYRLSVALAGGDKNKKRFFIPVTIKGSFTDLKYGLDLESAAKEQLKEEIDKKKDEVKEQADQKVKEKQKELGDKLQDSLKDMLKF
jgi:AsmA protein